MSAQHGETTTPIWRRKQAKDFLGVCESQVMKFERVGLLTAIRVPDMRTVWYDADQVRRLAENIRRGKLSTEPIEAP